MTHLTPTRRIARSTLSFSLVTRSARCLALALGAAMLHGCAHEGPPPAYPAHDVACHYIGLESVETPQYSRQSDRDAVLLTAVYRFDEPNVPAPKEPVTVKFQVDRSRVQELRSHLESQPDVVCTPDRDAHYHAKVRPFAARKRAVKAANQGATPVEGAPAPAAAIAPTSSDRPAIESATTPVPAAPGGPERPQNR
ncbi:MAG: hypothetical protein ABW321_10120 [Polyangiales bacterium]